MYETKFHTTDISKMHFLITGGAGFIGSNLVEYLLKYNAGKVRVLDNLSTGYIENLESYWNHPSFEFIEGDIRDLETCRKVMRGMHYVSHQAALGSVPRSIDDPILTNEVNISGFLNILTAAKDTPKVRRMVYAASSSTYGDYPGLPKVEDKIGRPLSPYAVTKAVNEIYADVFSRVYGYHTIGLRYFNVFGPRQSPNGAYAAVIPLFIKHLHENSSPVINGDGTQSRDFTFVENVVQANILAMLHSEAMDSSEVFNVACGSSISLNDLWQILLDISGKNIKPTYGNNRVGDIKDSLACINKIETFLGYSPHVNLKEGLTKLIFQKG